MLHPHQGGYVYRRGSEAVLLVYGYSEVSRAYLTARWSHGELAVGVVQFSQLLDTVPLGAKRLITAAPFSVQDSDLGATLDAWHRLVVGGLEKKWE